MDLSVIIVYYGRIQQKVKESAKMSWVGNPDLIKKHIVKYCEDNLCSSQLEQAVRLYTYTCTLGFYKVGAQSRGQEWLCWNGLRVCEVGVPMPSTRAAFLSPFVNANPVALQCPVHGPDAGRIAAEKEEKRQQRNASKSKEEPAGSRAGSVAEVRAERPSYHHSGSMQSSRPASAMDSSEYDTSSKTSSSGDEFDVFESDHSSDMNEDSHDHGHAAKDKDKEKQCCCSRYVRMHDSHKKARRRQHHQAVMDPELEQALRSLGDFDVMHCFAAILAGGLNLAKMILRLHFSIDPRAYQHLPPPMNATWHEAMLPWYTEFHRPSIHGRSRYNALLDSVVHGLLGDGYTSGIHEEVLDSMRVSHDATEKDNDVGLAENPLSPSSARESGLAADRFRQSSVMRPQEAKRRQASTVGPPDARSSVGQQSNGSGSIGSSKKPTATSGGVIGDMMLWTELYETESVFNYRTHFEHFSQWCHSAHLIPFFATLLSTMRNCRTLARSTLWWRKPSTVRSQLSIGAAYDSIILLRARLSSSTSP
jgi:hypothetical protein